MTFFIEIMTFSIEILAFSIEILAFSIEIFVFSIRILVFSIKIFVFSIEILPFSIVFAALFSEISSKTNAGIRSTPDYFFCFSICLMILPAWLRAMRGMRSSSVRPWRNGIS